MNQIKAVVGDVLLQTGQALQRCSLRSLGKNVRLQPMLHQYGLEATNLCHSVETCKSTFIGGKVNVNRQVKIGSNTMIRGDSDYVYLHYNSTIGNNTVITALEPELTDKSKGLPMFTSIGEGAKVGNNCVLNSCQVEPNSIIEDNCIIYHGAIIGQNTIIKANSIVQPFTKVIANQVYSSN